MRGWSTRGFRRRHYCAVALHTLRMLLANLPAPIEWTNIEFSQVAVLTPNLLPPGYLGPPCDFFISSPFNHSPTTSWIILWLASRVLGTVGFHALIFNTNITAEDHTCLFGSSKPYSPLSPCSPGFWSPPVTEPYCTWWTLFLFLLQVSSCPSQFILSGYQFKTQQVLNNNFLHVYFRLCREQCDNLWEPHRES